MSSSVRRIFMNAYLAYDQDPGESLQDFVADFDERIEDPVDVNLGQLSLNFCPSEPNIPTYENTIDLSYNGTRATYNLPTDLIYNGITGTGTGTTLVGELNTGFKATFGGTKDPWSYDSDRVRLVFTPDTGLSAEFYYDTTTASRRLGMTIADAQSLITSASPLTMGNQPVLSRTQCIFILCDMVADSITNSQGSNHSIMAQIPIYSPEYGTIINFSPSYDYGSMSNPRSFTNLRFRILDDLFQPMGFTSNANLLMSLYIKYAENDDGYAGQLKMPQF